MVKSISFWSFPAGTTIEGAMKLAKAAGFQAIELAVGVEGELSLESTPADLTRIRGLAESIGLKLPTLAAGLGWQYPVVSPDPAVSARGKQIVSKCLELAQGLGARRTLARG